MLRMDLLGCFWMTFIIFLFDRVKALVRSSYVLVLYLSLMLLRILILFRSGSIGMISAEMQLM